MFHLDNSETSWLVYADWLEDQDINAAHIRQEVVDLITTDWCWTFIPSPNGVGGHYMAVGSTVGIDNRVGYLGNVGFHGDVGFFHYPVGHNNQVGTYGILI